MEGNINHNPVDVKEIGLVLLDTGAILMSSGANTTRIRTTISRISEAFGYSTELLVTHRAIMLSVSDDAQNSFFSSLKRTSPHGVNFKVVSGVSRMSWRIVEEKWNIEQIKVELDRLESLQPYPRILILLLVSLAGSSFCRLFGGHWIEMGVVFIATFAGLLVRQETVKKNFNPYLCVYFGAAIASLISGLSVKLGWGSMPETAFATSVLFLVPGVPLINIFIDLMDGNLMNGTLRGINGLIISFSIALGLLTAMIIYQI
jgi:uncharacterized membrane protein YjjP (DUF1212 family)